MPSFYLCFVRTRKKLDKYFKVNRIRNKVIIDIRKIIEDENINLNNQKSLTFFKLLIWNKIKTAKDKNKDIYYIPNFTNPELNVEDLLKLKNTIMKDKKHKEYNLLLFFDEFLGTNWLLGIMDNLSHFEHSQIIKDY